MTFLLRFNGASFSILLASVVIATACGSGYSSPSGSQSSPSGGQPRTLTDVSVYSVTAPSIPVGEKATLVGIGIYGTAANPYQRNDVTNSATWTSSDPTVATVTKGIVSGIAVGSATITATFEGRTGSTTVVVGLTPNLTITPSGTTFSLSIPHQQFSATATYSDGTVLNLDAFVGWSSSPTGILEFEDDYDYPGLATFIATGTTTLTATLRPGEAGSLTVTVGP